MELFIKEEHIDYMSDFYNVISITYSMHLANAISLQSFEKNVKLSAYHQAQVPLKVSPCLCLHTF